MKKPTTIDLREYTSVSNRRSALENATGITLSAIGNNDLESTQAPNKNCENMIGSTNIPVGVAGPLEIHLIQKATPSVSRLVYIPLATTEGALIASVQRGTKVITSSGGVQVSVEECQTTRGPVFRVTSIDQGLQLEQYLKEHFNSLCFIAQATSHHLTLRSYSVDGAGSYRFVRFVFDTGNAMGLNMVTIATDAVVKQIQQDTGIVCVALSGNYCVDKKASWINTIMGRGRPVRSYVRIPHDVCMQMLKTTPKEIYEVWMAKCMLGSIMSGSMGWNAQAANVLAALFIATGQDPAHVVEGSTALTTTEIIPSQNGQEEDLGIGMSIPDLMVGTIGGGTGLPTQHEALSLLSVAGGDDAHNATWLGAIIAGAVLAGEISLLASLAQGTLTRAHVHLARGK